MQVNWLPTALGIILVLQTVLDHLKLKLTHGSHNAATIKLVDKQLCHTLVHQLLQSLLELLALHRIIILDILEEQWREGWQTAEVNLLTLGQRITDLEDAIVWQTYDIARISLVDGTLALRHKLGWRRETHGLVEAHMIVRLIAHKLARTDLAECDAGTVVRVDIGSNLEDETRKLRLLRLHHALLSLGRSWRWSYLNEAVQEFLHTEVVQCRAEEHRSHLGRAVGLDVKLRIYAIHQFQFLAQLGSLALAYSLVELLRLHIHLHLFGYALLVRRKEVELMLVDIIYTLESGALSDRP